MHVNTIKILKQYLVNQIDISNITIREDHVSFEYKNLNYVLFLKKDDSDYLQLCLPRVSKRQLKLEDMNKMLQLNSKYKVGKFFLEDGKPWISGEIFSTNDLCIEIIFRRLIQLLYEMYTEFKVYEHSNELDVQIISSVS